MKLCPQCHTQKPIDDFYPDRSRGDGLYFRCKDCERHRQLAENLSAEKLRHLREGNVRRARERKEANPRKVSLTQSLRTHKSRAKHKGLAFDLTLDDLPEWETIEYCPVFPWIKLDFGYKNGAATDNSPSIDRIDNTKGHIKGNVRIISFRANSLRKDGKRREFECLLMDARKLND